MLGFTFSLKKTVSSDFFSKNRKFYSTHVGIISHRRDPLLLIERSAATNGGQNYQDQLHIVTDDIWRSALCNWVENERPYVTYAGRSVSRAGGQTNVECVRKNGRSDVNLSNCT